MAAYRRVYDSRHLQADCQELGSPREPYARQSSMGYIYLIQVSLTLRFIQMHVMSATEFSVFIFLTFFWVFCSVSRLH